MKKRHRIKKTGANARLLFSALYFESVPTILSGEPVIKNTRKPVRAIVEQWKFGETAEEIARSLPHLRLAQIFDALGYYDDHREEIERYIELNRVPVKMGH